MFYHCCHEEIHPKPLIPVTIIMHNLKLDTGIVQHQKNLEKIRSKMILIDHQIFFNFVVNSTESVWRIKLNALSGTCSVKNVSQSKKPHPNRWTPTDAIASHVLKNFNQRKFIKVVVLFRRRKIAAVTNIDQREIFYSCNIFRDNN